MKIFLLGILGTNQPLSYSYQQLPPSRKQYNMSLPSRHSEFMEFVEDVIRTSVNDHANTTIRITTHEFLEHLYVKSPIEDKITSEIKNSPENPICIVGPRGSGKSSVGLKVKQDLLDDKEDRTFIVPIDIHIIRGSDFFDTRIPGDGQFRVYIRNQIVEFYKEVFYSREDPSCKFKLYEYVLNDKISKEFRPSDFFRPFAQLVADFHENYEKEVVNENVPLWQWLKVHHTTTEWVRKTIDDLRNMLKVEHYAAAMRHVMGYQRQIVWIDNIDSLSELDENEMNTAIREMVPTTNGIVRFVVAVREENVIQTEHPREAFGEPFQSVIFWSDASNASHQNNAWFVPVADEDRMRTIYFRRLEFSHLKAKSLSLNSEKDISDKEFAVLKSFAGKVIQAFYKERGIFIANNSLRDSMSILTDFIKYLLNKGYDTSGLRPLAYSYEHWFLQTELLFWLSRFATLPISYNFFNLLQHAENYLLSPNVEKIGCFHPYLVLTTIWNLCIEKEFANNTRFKLAQVREVYSRLASIGYEKNEVRSVLFQLCRQNQAKGMNNFIAIQISGELKSEDDIHENHLVRLTYRGQVTLNSVCNSYGYIFGLIEKNIELDYADTGRVRDAKSVLKALVVIAKAHLLSLKTIRDKYFQGQPDWMYIYYQRYGTPVSLRFSRLNAEKQGFEKFKGWHYALYFELVLKSIEHYRIFTSSIPVKEQLNKISDTYNELLGQLKNNSLVRDDDIKTAFEESNLFPR